MSQSLSKIIGNLPEDSPISSNTTMISIKNLSKRYSTKLAVNNINLSINKGEVVGFLGPNGAGKTTTMNMITGYISSTTGSITVNGYDILENPKMVKSSVGYLPETPPLYTDMTPLEYLSFVYDLKKAKSSSPNKRAHILDVMEMVNITDVAKRLIKNLSKGYKQRVGIAQALIGNPPVLILDEPTIGLDPMQIIEIRNLILSLGKNRTVIISSHILQEISAIAQRVIIINKGKIVAAGTPRSLSETLSDKNRFTVRITGDKSSVLTIANNIPQIRGVNVLGEVEVGSLDYDVVGECDLRTTLLRALGQDHDVLMLRPNILSLEDIFIKLTAEQQENEENKENEEVDHESSVE